jgi:hypothetical protein
VLRSARRMLRASSAFMVRIVTIWGSPRRSITGPARTLADTVTRLGWTHQSGDVFARPSDTPLSITQGSESWWQHEVRRSIRWAWAAATRPRRETPGLATQHIAWTATTLLTRRGFSRNFRQLLAPVLEPMGGFLDTRMRKSIGSILSGSVRDGVVLAKGQNPLRASEQCPFCHAACEDHIHIWRDCPPWDFHRLTAAGPRWAELFADNVPAYTKFLSIEAELPWVADQRAQLHQLLFLVPDRPFDVDASQHWHVFLDGSCSWPEAAEIRRAGCVAASSRSMRLAALLRSGLPLPSLRRRCLCRAPTRASL